MDALIMVTQTHTWQVKDNVAVFESPVFGCRIELLHPDRGLQDVRFGSQLLEELRPLQISPEPPAPPEGETLLESYVRGDDVVATYAQTQHRSARPQTYWRLLDRGRDGVGIELLVSIETDLLECNPSIGVLSTIPTDQVLCLGGVGDSISDGFETATEDCETATVGGLVLFRLAECDLSYCEMVFPSDLQSTQIIRDGALTQLRRRLFPDSLEKGVIRRTRVRGFVMAREGDERLAGDLYREMLASLPPLNT